MARTRYGFIAVAAVVASLWVAAPAFAAGETFQVQTVDAKGCASGDFDMTVLKANLDGGSYFVRTLVTVEGLAYMNEQASTSTNGPSPWSIFNNFTYGALPNQGTYPIPQNKVMRLDFTVERPKGTILYAWSLVVDSCNTGNILYNGLTAADLDKDFVAIPADKCPKVAGIGRPNGCPLRARSLAIAYDTASHRFFGWLFAEGFSSFHSHRAVTVWKVRPGPDRRIGTVKTTGRGNWALGHARQAGRYYATAKALLLPKLGQVPKETSLTLRLR